MFSCGSVGLSLPHPARKAAATAKGSTRPRPLMMVDMKDVS
jgi:hypothetical protein